MSKETSFEVIGGSVIGEKAGMLREHESLIQEAGLQIPPTTVIAGEALLSIRDRLGNEVSQASEPKLPIGAILAGVVAKNADVPALAVRSSAEGDARGSGIYESVISPNRRRSVGRALQQVLQSFHTEAAKDFRREADLGDAFAVMLQPLVGQALESKTGQALDADDLEVYGPPLSGYGYSSTASDKDGFINVVAGIGGGVSRKGGERITPWIISNLNERELSNMRWRSVGIDDPTPAHDKPVTLRELVGVQRYARIQGWINTESDFRPSHGNIFDDEGRSIGGEVFLSNYGPGELSSYSISQTSPEFVEIPEGSIIMEGLNGEKVLGQFIKEDRPLRTAMEAFEPQRFLDTLHDMEAAAGYPLYVEWAMTTHEGGLIPWIVQIAPVEAKGLSSVEAVQFKERYYAANNVVGSGQKQAKKIVTCWNPGDLQHLQDFNSDPDNAGYVLVYSSRLTTSISTHGQMMAFEDCYRASTILEIQDARHSTGSPIDHILGAVDQTGKFFGVIDFDQMDERVFKAPASTEWRSPNASSEIMPGKLVISEGDFTVVADEKNDKLVVGLV
jgi:hypothetical protein